MMPGVPLNKAEQIENPKVQIRIRKLTVRRLKSKRIPPESYDDVINRVFDEYPDAVAIVELIHRVEKLEKKARK